MQHCKNIHSGNCYKNNLYSYIIIILPLCYYQNDYFPHHHGLPSTVDKPV